jgi:pimeloyl-ACP methyl ester carboxylesterase
MVETLVQAEDGVRLRTWTTGLGRPGRPAVVLLHGGPGLPDYLEPVAALIDDLCLVHRYDQRGTGGSTWTGEHTIARHLDDLVSLLDAWGHERVVLVGHSFGTVLASYFLLRHPERVAGLVQIAGPFLDLWRDAYVATERARRSAVQQARFEELAAVEGRSDAEEIDFLTLSWLPDHADRSRAEAWAHESALALRPVNYVMNRQLNTATKVEPLESRVAELRRLLPPGTLVIGGSADPRPAAALVRLGERLACEVVLLDGAGHHPWLEAPAEFAAALRAAVERQL